MITIVAKLRTQDGKGDAFAEAARGQIAAVAANEQGKTLVYTLHRSTTDPNLFLFYEQYADADALAAHGTTDHMKAFGGQIRDLLAGRPEIERYESIVGLGG